MEPTKTLDTQAPKAIIKESVREVMGEEWFKFFEMRVLYVDDEEQAEIEAQFSPANFKNDDFTDVTHWFFHEDKT